MSLAESMKIARLYSIVYWHTFVGYTFSTQLSVFVFMANVITPMRLHFPLRCHYVHHSGTLPTTSLIVPQEPDFQVVTSLCLARCNSWMNDPQYRVKPSLGTSLQT